LKVFNSIIRAFNTDQMRGVGHRRYRFLFPSVHGHHQHNWFRVESQRLAK